MQQQLALPPPPPPQPCNDDRGANRAAKLTPGTIATRLSDGKKLCPDFQKGMCKVKKASCPLGLHKCGMVTRRCRVCAPCMRDELDQLLRFCRCNFIFLILFGFLKQNIRPKYAPPRRTNYTLKWRGGEAAPPIYFILRRPSNLLYIYPS